jgi:hypothetical protein
MAGGGVGSWFMFKENKRAKRLENDKSAAAEWKELFEQSDKKVDAQSIKIDGLFKALEDERKQRNRVETDLAVAQLKMCQKLACAERDPPFGSQTHKDTLI